MSPALIAVVAALGMAHIVARYQNARGVAGVLKALPIALLALSVWQGPTVDARYGSRIVGGLVASLIGDVCLVFPAGFVAGLASFLVGHLFYIGAFTTAGGWDARAWLLAGPFLLAGAVMLGVLWPHLGRLRAPVAVYALVIAVMAWRATVRAAVPVAGGTLALAGATLFMLSDGLLATDRFARPFRAADGAVMVTYYAAQTLIAASALG